MVVSTAGSPFHSLIVRDKQSRDMHQFWSEAVGNIDHGPLCGYIS